MATITIRRLDDSVKSRLRVRAAQNNRSMEEEAREILTRGLASMPPSSKNLYDAIRKHVDAVGGIDLELPKRELPRKFPDFSS